MRIAVRADSGTQIGGGHVMRCLSLAVAAQKAGHEVCFICADVVGHLGARIKAAGIDTLWLTPSEQETQSDQIENWRPLSVECDAKETIGLLADFSPEWVILDHYGLGGAWVKHLRAGLPEIKVLALDDLDREPLYADLQLNPAAVSGTSITQPQMGMLKGPRYAMLRPEFIDARPAALKRRTGKVHKVLIMPGMVDHTFMAPAALEALSAFQDLEVEVIMGGQSPSVTVVEKLIAEQRNWSLTLDATDIAKRMIDADACIGAGGGSAWERCCLGLPSLNIALAENQMPGIQAISDVGAGIGLPPAALNELESIRTAFTQLLDNYLTLSENAAALCDGCGAARVVSALSGELRCASMDDAQLIFDWRNQAHIREASLSADPLIWDDHNAYLKRVLDDSNNHVWCIYQEGGSDLGVVNAKRLEDQSWTWGFYIGAPKPPKGAGRRMLIHFLRHLLMQPNFKGVHAVVLAANNRSLALHEALGFRRVSDKSASEVHYTLDRETLTSRLGLSQ